MHWSLMGAPRLYWWWDAICPVCHLFSKLFIHHPYSQSSKASNPRLPRWSTDREADRRAGCKSVPKMFNTLSMTEHFKFTKFSQWVSVGLSAGGNPDSFNSVQNACSPKTERRTCCGFHLTDGSGLGPHSKFWLQSSFNLFSMDGKSFFHHFKLNILCTFYSIKPQSRSVFTNSSSI